jgi:hypothetical protein
MEPVEKGDFVEVEYFPIPKEGCIEAEWRVVPEDE